LLKNGCLSKDPLTLTAGLAVFGKLLEILIQAVKLVSVALNDLYAKLSGEQKARFVAIGPQQTARLDELEAAPTDDSGRRRGIPNPEQIIGVCPRHWAASHRRTIGETASRVELCEQ
jgi:hypothetical protein